MVMREHSMGRIAQTTMQDSTRVIIVVKTSSGNFLQALVPIFLEYLPTAATFLCALFGVPIDATFGTVLLSMYPVVEPVLLIYFVRDYRLAFWNLMLCGSTRTSKTSVATRSAGAVISVQAAPNTMKTISTLKI